MENENSKKVKIMAKVSDNYSIRPGLTRLAPHLSGVDVPQDAIKKLYFSSSSAIAYRPVNGGTSSSFSDVHKASQKIQSSKSVKAPFWSRDMTRCESCFFFPSSSCLDISKRLFLCPSMELLSIVSLPKHSIPTTQILQQRTDRSASLHSIGRDIEKISPVPTGALFITGLRA